MRTVQRIAVAVSIALLAAACGETTDGGGAGGDTIDHPTGGDEVVLRVELEGGFVPYEYMLTRVPSWTLYGDGTLIVEGPQIEIYPPPALPNLLATRLTEDGVQAILEAARAAGLMDGDADYGYACITDAATTVFTITADGTTSMVSAYALEAAGQCPDVNEEARGSLRDFQATLGNLASWLPEGSIGQEQPFEPSELRLHVGGYTPDPELPQQPVEWPLSTSLAGFGEPIDGGDLRCAVVSGAELAALLPVLQGANALTPWQSDGADHRLIVRPLLPDEHGC